MSEMEADRRDGGRRLVHVVEQVRSRVRLLRDLPASARDSRVTDPHRRGVGATGAIGATGAVEGRRDRPQAHVHVGREQHVECRDGRVD